MSDNVATETADREALRQGLRDVLEGACPPAVVRAAWDDSTSSDAFAGVWRRLTEFGLPGLLAPPECGGTGAAEPDLVVAMEECGRYAVPGPVLEHIALGVPVLASAADPRAAAAASGATLLTAADPDTQRAAWADRAELVVDLGGTVPRVASVHDLDLGQPVPSVDGSQRWFTIAGDAGNPTTGADVAALQRRAALAAAAQLLGLADRMIELTVQHATTRKQFGVLIGSQQAVKHHLANAAIALAHARPVVYDAAQAAAHDVSTAQRDVSFAKVYAGRAAYTAGRAALQCHGAIGYSFEYDLHLWLKRAWTLDVAWGTRRQHEAVVAQSVLGTPPQ